MGVEETIHGEKWSKILAAKAFCVVGGFYVIELFPVIAHAKSKGGLNYLPCPTPQVCAEQHLKDTLSTI